MKFQGKYIFRGNDAKTTVIPSDGIHVEPEPYIASEKLVEAVNLSIYLNRPLLLEGEAGCGKTRLASAVAGEFRLPMYIWNVRSDSKAQDGLYTYDAVLRLHDVQTASLPNAPRLRDPSQPKDYRRLGPLGKAFAQNDVPAVVLIDEIDKADVDFPNDLLAVLDKPWQFEIPETGEVVKVADQFRPMVIITSNKEKGNLPSPFLRRCVYFYLELPADPEWLKKIVRAHYQIRNEQAPEEQLLNAAANTFLELRRSGGLHKKPGTSEFLDWVHALHGYPPGVQKHAELREKDPLPYPELLFKLRADWLNQVKQNAAAS